MRTLNAIVEHSPPNIKMNQAIHIGGALKCSMTKPIKKSTPPKKNDKMPLLIDE